MALLADSENTAPGKEKLDSVPWIQISQRLGINSTKVNGFYKYRGTTNSKRACYLKNRTEDCWIYFQHSKTQGNVWFIGDPKKGNYAYVVEDLEIPVAPTQPLHIWNGKEFEEDASVQMRVYNPEEDSEVGVVKRELQGKLNNLGKVTAYHEGEVIFGTLKEHIEQSRPTMDIHYNALMDGVIDKMFQMLETDVDAIKKTLYKFLGLFIYYFKELKDVKKKRNLGVWCNKIFSHCLPYIHAEFVVCEMDVAKKPQVLVNATLVLRNSMEFITDVSPENSKLLIPIVQACINGMTSNSDELSQTDREIFSGPIYMAALFDSVNQSISLPDVSHAARTLINEEKTSNSFRLKLWRLITSLSGAQQNSLVQVEPLFNALKFSMWGKPPAHQVGDLRWVLWHACFIVKCLASCDAHKAELINLGAVNICVEIISKEFNGQDLYLIPNKENRIQAFGILEHLSFARKFRPHLIRHKPFQLLLDKFKYDEQLGHYVERILWNLKTDFNAIKKTERAPTGPILICFTRLDEEVRTRVLKAVEDKSTFDGVLNEFDDITSMTAGVDQASVILLGLSPNLEKSAKMRIEVEYAIASGKSIMALNIAHPHYPRRMCGWLEQFQDYTIDMSSHDELPAKMEELLNRIKDGLNKSSDVISHQFLPMSRGNAYNSRLVSPLEVGTQSAAQNNWTSVDEVYTWLRDVVHLENDEIDRFRKSGMTIESFVQLSYLATKNFSSFSKFLSTPDYKFSGGIILHLAHFFMREYNSRLLPYSRQALIKTREERKDDYVPPTRMVSRQI